MLKEFRSSHKKIYDPIHGFIKFDENEKVLIDSFPFQRLHYIHQLGGSYLVFPGATHTRFAHALGMMELATKIYQWLCKNERPDLFHFLPRSGSSKYIYWKKVIRLAALCHDLGQLPFSFVPDNDFFEHGGHERWTLKIIRSKALEKVWEKINSEMLYAPSQREEDLIDDVIKISLGEETLKEIDPEKDYEFDNWQRILSDIINGTFFGAERIDHLLRDSKFTGVVYGLFDYLQLIESLRILPESESKTENLKLGIDENGVESCEALVLALHFMHKRVYQNSTVRAYNFHLKRFLKNIYSQSDVLNDIGKFLSQNDPVILNELSLAAKNKMHIGHEDAKILINRKDRFKAISISDKISERDLIKFKNKYDISDENIAWEIFEKKEEMNLTFPVAKHHLTIIKAMDSSTLFSCLPSNRSNWVYVAPEYEISVIKFLEKK